MILSPVMPYVLGFCFKLGINRQKMGPSKPWLSLQRLTWVNHFKQADQCFFWASFMKLFGNLKQKPSTYGITELKIMT